jgi:hypothetical protein
MYIMKWRFVLSVRRPKQQSHSQTDIVSARTFNNILPRQRTRNRSMITVCVNHDRRCATPVSFLNIKSVAAL